MRRVSLARCAVGELSAFARVFAVVGRRRGSRVSRAEIRGRGQVPRVTARRVIRGRDASHKFLVAATRFFGRVVLQRNSHKRRRN